MGSTEQVKDLLFSQLRNPTLYYTANDLNNS